MTLQDRIHALAALGEWIPEMLDSADFQSVATRAYHENAWFTPDNIRKSIASIASAFLDKHNLEKWVSNYPVFSGIHPEKTVGLVMAGNIPAVGFHDWLCVFIAGHRAKIKLSDKDRLLIPFLIKKLGEINFESWEYTEFTGEGERLSGFDAVIATGSNNTTRYFEQYFGKYPHIIRGNRNSVAVLDGSETPDELRALGEDVFSYFGLGCRNVSKLYVPAGYDFNPLLEALHTFNDLANHDKYRNNFDYNITLYILNNAPFLNNGCIILMENPALQTRISTLHYEYYNNGAQLEAMLQEKASEIQCITGKNDIGQLKVLPFGTTQQPGLADYADGVDTLRFLTNGFI